ncbi:Up-regulator of cell proliferation [Cichlidogyrus casuarinus]|uniref:Up-regulator of cell proliferation n=1 Tax=Cichlidogyrus casuarinus TaxID=1844966 RepID=A0ABD2PY85_9PLAT
MCSFLGQCLHELRLAVPLLLRDKAQPKLRLMNTVSSIVFKSDETGLETQLIKESLPIISFVRMGRLETKSEIVNHFLSDGAQQSMNGAYFTEHMPRVVKMTQDGTVDITWHQQKESNRPKSVILNAHGDMNMNQYRDLLQWLIKVSNVIVIFMYEHEKQKFVDQLKKPKFSNFLILLKPEEGWDYCSIKNCLNENVYSDIHSSSTRSIDEILQESNSIFDAEKKMNLAILQSLDGLNTGLQDIQQFQKLDSLWRKYVKLAKEDTRAKPTGKKSIQDIRSEVKNKKAQTGEEIKRLQLNTMKVFEELSDKLLEARKIDPIFGLRDAFTHLNGVSKDILLRKIAQSYELEDVLKINESSSLDLVTKMLLDGYSIEIFDGTNNWIYKKWLTNILKRMDELISDAKVVILSVLGVQSSFKSTLLNIMFGESFKTGLGKCTEGIHATLLTLDSGMRKILNYTHILVLDVEGLQSTEKREENDANDFDRQDNELATAVVCMSDLCLINFRGESVTALEGTLEICMFAIARMVAINECKICCQTEFVHHNIEGVNAEQKTEELRKTIHNKFERAKKDVMREEGEYLDPNFLNKSFVIESDKPPTYLPNYKNESGVYQRAYTEKIAQLKKKILGKLNCHGVSFGEIGSRIESVWDSMLHENFILNFKCAIHIHVTNLIEKEYLRISNEFNTEAMRLENQALAKIYEGDTEFNLREFLDTELAPTKKKLIQKFEEFLDFGKNADMEEGLKEQYKLRLGITMGNIREEQITRLKRRIELKKLETELERKNNKFTDAFIKGCKEKLDTLAGSSRKKLNGHFEKLFKKEKERYLAEAKIVMKENEPCINQILQKKLSDLFPDVAGSDKIEDKYSKYGRSIAKSVNTFEVKTKHYSSFFIANCKYVQKYLENNAFVKDLSKTIRKKIGEFFRTKEFESCGVCDLTIGHMVNKINELIAVEIETKGLNKIFQRDFTYYMCYDILLEDLTKLQEELVQKYDPERFMMRSKPILKDIFVNLCSKEIQLSTFTKKVSDTLVSMVHEDLLKIKEQVIADKMKNLFGKLSKQELLNVMLQDAVETDNCLDRVMLFVNDPNEFMERFFQKKVAEEGDSVEVTKELEKMAKCTREQFKTLLNDKNFLEGIDTCGKWLDRLYKLFPLLDFSKKSQLELFRTINIPEEDKFNLKDEFKERIKEKDDIDEKDEFRKGMEAIKVTLEELCLKIPSEMEGKMVEEIASKMTDSTIGCKKQCPVCGAICEKKIPNHSRKHYSSNHSSICLKHTLIKDGKLLSESCFDSIRTQNIQQLLKENAKDIKIFKTWNMNLGTQIKPFWIWFIQTNERKLSAIRNSPVNLDSKLLKTKVTRASAIASLKEKYIFSFPGNVSYYCNLL